MIRLFVGLSVPEDVSERIAMMAQPLPGARWVEPENLHITLRFIGEVSEHDAEEVHHQLARVVAPAFDIEAAGLETFGQGRKAHALYLRIALTESLALLQGRVESAVVKAGQPREGRKFKPHITLARLKGPDELRLQSFIINNNLFRSDAFPVESFVLYESRLGHSGATYSFLEEYPLQQIL